MAGPVGPSLVAGALLALVACAPGAPAGRSAPRAAAEADLEAARRLPVPEGNYEVEVERIWLGETDAWAIGALFAHVDEHVAVRVGRPSLAPSFRVGVAAGDFHVVLDATLRRTRGAERARLRLLSLPDRPASLWVGETRYVETFRAEYWPYGVRVVEAEGQFVGASLDVAVSAAGPGRVDVSLAPAFSRLAGYGRTVRFTNLATTVTVPLDQPLLVTSHDRQTHDVVTTLLARRSKRGRERGVLVLTVRGG